MVSAGSDVRANATLSPREREVWHWFALGLSSAETGREMGISENTVRGYRSALMRKFRCKRLALMPAELILAEILTTTPH